MQKKRLLSKYIRRTRRCPFFCGKIPSCCLTHVLVVLDDTNSAVPVHLSLFFISAHHCHRQMAEIDVKIGGATLCSPPEFNRKRVRFSEVDVLATYHLHDDASSTSSGHDEASPHSYGTTSGQKNFKIRERRSQASLASDFRGRYLSIQPVMSWYLRGTF